MVLKTEYKGLELKFFRHLKTILPDLGLELYDLDWAPSSGQLTIYIFNSETKTAVLDDCVKVDRALSPFIDEDGEMPENLTLEVSSPGLYRHLNTISHFKGVIGEHVLLTLLTKISEEQSPDLPKALRNNLKIKFYLKEVKDEGVVVMTKDVDVFIPFAQIKKANLETEINYNKNSLKA